MIVAKKIFSSFFSLLESSPFGMSLFAHIAFFLCVFLFSVISKLFFYSDLQLALLQKSVRVDVVAMPKLTLKELQTVTDQVEAIKEDVRKEEAAKEKIEDEDLVFEKEGKKDFQDILKNLSEKKIDAKKIADANKKKNSLKLSDNDLTKLKKLVLEGNKINSGDSATERADGAAIQGEFGKYLTQIPDWVKPNWRLPSYFQKENLKCRIRIFLDAKGNLIKVDVYESSGNAEYDEKALLAVKNSSPYPEVPNLILSRVYQGDIILGFPL